MLNNYPESSTGLRHGGELRDLVRERISRILSKLPLERSAAAATLLPGKMLRTRLAECLTAAGGTLALRETLVAASAATEMVHTASLCHDDVIDESPLRRHHPSLWTVCGRPAAVLTGDLLICEAMKLMLETEGGLYAGSFLGKVRQVVEAEIRQELICRGQALEEAGCLEIARGKTGPLFAFMAEVCAGPDLALRQALEQAGYLLGTAYQLADDLIDVAGREEMAGKALGSDAERGKFTLAQSGPAGAQHTAVLIQRLFHEAIAKVRAWRFARQGLEEFISHELRDGLAAQGITILLEPEL